MMTTTTTTTTTRRAPFRGAVAVPAIHPQAALPECLVRACHACVCAVVGASLFCFAQPAVPCVLGNYVKRVSYCCVSVAHAAGPAKPIRARVRSSTWKGSAGPWAAEAVPPHHHHSNTSTSRSTSATAPCSWPRCARARRTPRRCAASAPWCRPVRCPGLVVGWTRARATGGADAPFIRE